MPRLGIAANRSADFEGKKDMGSTRELEKVSFFRMIAPANPQPRRSDGAKKQW